MKGGWACTLGRNSREKGQVGGRNIFFRTSFVVRHTETESGKLHGKAGLGRACRCCGEVQGWAGSGGQAGNGAGLSLLSYMEPEGNNTSRPIVGATDCVAPGTG